MNGDEVYLHAYENVWEAERSIGAYIRFYNQERLHSSLGYQTPLSLYKLKNGLLSISEKGENKSLYICGCFIQLLGHSVIFLNELREVWLKYVPFGYFLSNGYFTCNINILNKTCFFLC